MSGPEKKARWPRELGTRTCDKGAGRNCGRSAADMGVLKKDVLLPKPQRGVS
jgi:hypothetical protein